MVLSLSNLGNELLKASTATTKRRSSLNELNQELAALLGKVNSLQANTSYLSKPAPEVPLPNIPASSPSKLVSLLTGKIHKRKEVPIAVKKTVPIAVPIFMSKTVVVLKTTPIVTKKIKTALPKKTKTDSIVLKMKASKRTQEPSPPVEPTVMSEIEVGSVKAKRKLFSFRKAVP
jgi:hypothetical protein